METLTFLEDCRESFFYQVSSLFSNIFRIGSKPFLKWAGGKSQLLDQLTDLFPKSFSRYCEPFAGSAAVYWHIFSLREKGKLNFTSARITDSNAELINTYRMVRDDVKALIELLLAHRKNHNKEYYYQIRSLRPGRLTDIERAARFIYLNKTCFIWFISR